MDSNRCSDDTSGFIGYGLDAKAAARMMTGPNAVGPRHTIDNILGLARKEDDRERSITPGNGESA
ncbi:hypothetical protein HHI36_002332, partial [Cryptolaemus montrouzieri]